MDLEKEFQERFDWRRKLFISNMLELSQFAQAGGSDVINLLPSLFHVGGPDTPEYALRWSNLSLWLQATECFIFGQYEPCILTCGSIMERILKLEYRMIKRSLPEGIWTLGKCVKNLDWSNTRVSEKILDLVGECIDPRNDRAHALLEHSDPSLAIIGGKTRDIQELSSSTYIIEHYKCDARLLIGNTWKILQMLYSKRDSNFGEA